MYKLKVEVGFTDKITNENYEVGDVIEVTDERAEELLNNPSKLVSFVTKDTEEKGTKGETIVTPEAEIKEEESTGITIKNNKPKKKNK